MEFSLEFEKIVYYYFVEIPSAACAPSQSHYRPNKIQF